MGEIDLTKKIPEMWPQYEALGGMPTLLIRGENSDLLSPQTVQKMSECHPGLELLTVAGQGHAPLLRDPESQQAIAAFLAASDPG